MGKKKKGGKTDSSGGESSSGPPAQQQPPQLQQPQPPQQSAGGAWGGRGRGRGDPERQATPEQSFQPQQHPQAQGGGDGVGSWGNRGGRGRGQDRGRGRGQGYGSGDPGRQTTPEYSTQPQQQPQQVQTQQHGAAPWGNRGGHGDQHAGGRGQTSPEHQVGSFEQQGGGRGRGQKGGRGRGHGQDRGRGASHGGGDSREQTPIPSQQSSPRPSQPPTPQPGPPRVDVSSLSRGLEPVKIEGDPNINIVSKAGKGGTLGRPIALRTNHFELRLGKVEKVYHYDVDINPDRPKKMLKEVMQLFRAQHYSTFHPAFDGVKNIFSARELPFGNHAEGTIMIDEPNSRPKEFKVKIQKVNMIDLTLIKKYFEKPTTRALEDVPMIVRQALDIALRHSLSLRNIVVGSSFFSPPQGPIIKLGNGMDMYRGSFQSVVMGWKPFLNVDVANKAFPSAINVIKLIEELAERNFDPHRPLDYRILDMLTAHLKGLRICYDLPNNPSAKKNYRVNGIDKSPLEVKFKKSDGIEMTVEYYYRTEKKLKLNYPNMPCLWVGSMQSEQRVRIPCEFCTVLPGQVVNRKLTANQTRAMIKECATNTAVRQNSVATAVRNANYNNDPTVKEFDIYINDKFTELNGRVLNPPDLLYGGNNVQRPRKGVWNASTFLDPKKLIQWTILNLDRRTAVPQLDMLEKMVINKGASLGMTIDKAQKPFQTLTPRYNKETEELEQYFIKCKQKNIELVFVIITDQDKIYNYVKQAAELTAGCLTQCIKSFTLQRKMNDATIGNILLKVNAKLDGKNHRLNRAPDLMSVPTMIMGADVTHPSPDNKEIPSVAAVTASHDPNAFMYNICWRLQPPGKEMIADMEDITREHLLHFRKCTRVTPKRIIFYRDGVSDGQFVEVLRYELSAIRRACQKLNKDYKPAVTFLVVQKRHHTRLFVCNDRDSEDRNMNVPAGTLVDTMITHRTRQNFFLVSHASIQGVAKPTKYVTLWDENDLTDDQLESLTYYLCHMFARCTRSVSYPAPTYYAHLAAARAKVYCETRRLNMDNLPNEQLRIKIKDCIVKDLPMFFI